MSLKLPVYNQNAESIGEMELSPKVFGVKANTALVHQAVVAQMANKRQVLAHTKDRGEVRGGGRKPWRQKGTGRARHGSIRSPIWVGGGITFGPRKDRNFKKNINQKMKKKAIFMALSDKVANAKMVVLDKLEVGEYKTKIFNEILKNIETKILFVAAVKDKAGEAKIAKKKIARNILMIIADKDDKIKYSSRNLVGVKLINLANINLVDILKYKYLILTKEVIKKIEESVKSIK